MATTNNERVGQALALLAQGLAPFVDRECGLKYGLDWENAVPGDGRDVEDRHPVPAPDDDEHLARRSSSGRSGAWSATTSPS